MKLIDIAVLAIIALIVILIVKYMFKQKAKDNKQNKCAGCSHAANCHINTDEENNDKNTPEKIRGRF